MLVAVSLGRAAGAKEIVVKESIATKGVEEITNANAVQLRWGRALASTSAFIGVRDGLWPTFALQNNRRARREVQHSPTKGSRIGVAMLDKKDGNNLLIFGAYAVCLNPSIVVYAALIDY